MTDDTSDPPAELFFGRDTELDQVNRMITALEDAGFDCDPSFGEGKVVIDE